MTISYISGILRGLAHIIMGFVYKAVFVFMVCHFNVSQGICPELKAYPTYHRDSLLELITEQTWGTCVFPFQHNKEIHTKCYKNDCGLTFNIDRDQKWGACKPPIVHPDGTVSGRFCSDKCENGMCNGSSCQPVDTEALCFQRSECVMSCASMRDGHYRSCKSCNTLVSCQGGKLEEQTCSHGMIYHEVNGCNGDVTNGCMVMDTGMDRFYIGGPGTLFETKSSDINSKIRIKSNKNGDKYYVYPGIINNLQRIEINTDTVEQSYTIQYTSDNAEVASASFLLPIGVLEPEQDTLKVKCGDRDAVRSETSTVASSSIPFPSTTKETIEKTTGTKSSRPPTDQEVASTSLLPNTTELSSPTTESTNSEVITTTEVIESSMAPTNLTVTTTTATTTERGVLSTSAENSVQENQKQKDMGIFDSSGATIAIAVGASVIVICIIAVIAVLCFVRRRSKSDNDKEATAISHTNPVFNNEDLSQLTTSEPTNTDVDDQAPYAVPNKAGIYSMPKQRKAVLKHDIYDGDNIANQQDVSIMVDNEVYHSSPLTEDTPNSSLHVLQQVDLEQGKPGSEGIAKEPMESPENDGASSGDEGVDMEENHIYEGGGGICFRDRHVGRNGEAIRESVVDMVDNDIYND